MRVVTGIALNLPLWIELDVGVVDGRGQAQRHVAGRVVGDRQCVIIDERERMAAGEIGSKVSAGAGRQSGPASHRDFRAAAADGAEGYGAVVATQTEL